MLNASLPPSPGADGHFSFGKTPYGGSPKGPTPPPTRATGGSDAQMIFIGMKTEELANKPEGFPNTINPFRPSHFERKVGTLCPHSFSQKSAKSPIMTNAVRAIIGMVTYPNVLK